MRISKRIGLALAIFVGLAAAGCNDSVSCMTACPHLVGCLVDAGVTDLPANFCDVQCDPATDGGKAGCPGIGMTYDCINGLSCADILAGDAQGTPLHACEQKAGC